MTTTNSKLRLTSRPNWLQDVWLQMVRPMVPLDVWRSSLKPGCMVDFVDGDLRPLSGVVIEIHSSHHGPTMVDVLTRGRPTQHMIPMRHIFPEGTNQRLGYYSDVEGPEPGDDAGLL